MVLLENGGGGDLSVEPTTNETLDVITTPRETIKEDQNQGLLPGLSLENPTTHCIEADQPLCLPQCICKFIMGSVCHKVKKECSFFDTLAGTLDNSPSLIKTVELYYLMKAKFCLT